MTRKYIIRTGLSTGILIILFYAFSFYISLSAKKINEQNFQEHQLLEVSQSKLSIETSYGYIRSILNLTSQKIEIAPWEIAENNLLEKDLSIFFRDIVEEYAFVDHIILFSEKGTPHVEDSVYAIAPQLFSRLHPVVQQYLDEKNYDKKTSDIIQFEKKFYLCVFEPIFRTSFQGVIVAVVNISDIAEAYVKPIRIGDFGAAWMESCDGTVIYDHEEEIIGENVLDPNGIHKDYEVLLAIDRKMIAEPMGYDEYSFTVKRGGKKSRKLVAWVHAYLGDTKVIIPISTPDFKVNKSLGEHQTKLYVFVGFFIFIFIFIAILFTNYRTKLYVQEERAKLIPKLEDTIKTLDEFQKKYRTIFESIPEVIYSLDAELKPSYLSENVQHLTGYTTAEIDENPSIWRNVVQLEKIKSFFNDKNRKDNSFEFEYSIDDKNGDEKWINNRGRVTLDLDKTGSFRCEGILIDTTERKKLEQKLAESEEKYRNLVEETLSGIAIYKKDGFMFMNKAGLNMFGFSEREELFARDICDLIDQENCFAQSLLNKDYEGEIPLHIEAEAIKKDGSRFLMELIVHPTCYLGENVLQLSFRDITDVKRVEEENKRSEMMVIRAGRLSAIGDLAAGVAHEINNPLSGIMLKTELLKYEFEEGSENYNELDRILELSNRISKIVKELSFFTKRSEGSRLKVKLQDTLQSSLFLISNRIRKHGIIVNENFESNIPYVYAQPQDIQQLFVNIINNSRLALNEKFGEGPDPQKIITITGKKEKRNNQNVVLISFRDEGIGIPKRNLDRVFDPFFSTRRPTDSIGTGLSICQKIMEEHGGKIYIDSQEGLYTVLTLEFPAVSYNTPVNRMQ